MSASNYHLLSERRTDPLLNAIDIEEEHTAPLETIRSNTRVVNLDDFLVKVYNYYHGKGFLNIFLTKFLNLLTLLWVFILTVFLSSYIDYSILFSTYSLPTAVHFQGFHPLLILCLIIFISFYISEFYRFIRDTIENLEMKRFYDYDLYISGNDLQTCEWREVVNKLIRVPGFQSLTALDIANRIMRKDNYMIAMINKDVFDLGKKPVLTKIVEWSIGWTVFDLVFPRHSQGVNPQVLEPAYTPSLVAQLRQRFRILGILTLFLSPFIFVFLLIYSFFRYTEELKNSPSRFATRQWTPLARWKFRELNELPHVFQKRLNASYESAGYYVNAFPSRFVAIVAGFLSFVIASVLAVLIVVGFVDDQALFQVEILEGRSAIWFLGVGGTLVAILRGLVPEESQIRDPQKTMETIVQHTHYLPKSWRNNVHSYNVYLQFSALFELKAVLVISELMSVFLTPWILLVTLPRSADKIIEFFRLNSIKQDGVGYVCKYAVFPMDSEDVYSLNISGTKMKQGKVEKSFLNFKANHPEWRPAPSGEKYLENLTEALSESQIPNFKPLKARSEETLHKSVFQDPPSLEASIASLNKIHRYFYRSSLQSPQDNKMQ